MEFSHFMDTLQDADTEVFTKYVKDFYQAPDFKNFLQRGHFETYVGCDISVRYKKIRDREKEEENASRNVPPCEPCEGC